MTALFNPSPLVLGTLQNLSLLLNRSTAISRGPGGAGLAVGRSEARAFGGLDMAIDRTGQSLPAKVRYGAITIAPRAQGSAFSKSPGVHPAIDRAYDNPGVRFGNQVKGGERPTSAAGETSCHFSQTSVSKTSPIREMIKAARGGRRLAGSRAAAHVLYVEREGAPEQVEKRGAERLRGEAFTAEIERRGIDRSAVAQQVYIERAGAAEGIERKPGRRITDEELDALDEASFGTIGATVEERTQFWLAVEEAEATPKGDRITIRPRDNPEWWSKVAEAVDHAPSAAQRPLRDALARDDELFELKLPTDKAFAVHQWAVGLDTAAPLEISPGRGGRTQTRVIAELPHELDGRERLQIVRDFTQKLAEKGFPYWAVIHAPDTNNDARNFHVHIAYYDRPTTRITTSSGGEVWDFEVQEERRYPNRTKYLVRPHQQNRLRETNNQDWVTELRKHWETVSNRVLEDAGLSKRYNLGTYENMGIDLEPLQHINSRTFNKERKGELTEEGPVLARRQWDTVHDRLVKDHEIKARKRKHSLKRMAEHATKVARAVPGAARKAGEIGRLKELGVKASFQLALLELHQDLTRLVVDRIASRPKLMMSAVNKAEVKARKKKGIADDAPPRDGPVAGASLFGLELRSDVITFLTAIYDGGLRLDRENAARANIARNNVRLIVQEMRKRVANPAYPTLPGRSLATATLHEFDSDERLKVRAARQQSMEEQFRAASQESLDSAVVAMSSVLKTAPPVPDQLERRTAPARAASPATAAPNDARPAKSRYRPGRRDTDTNAEMVPPIRIAPPITLPAGYGPQGRSSGAPAMGARPVEASSLPRPIKPVSDERRSVVPQNPTTKREVLRERQAAEADTPNPMPTRAADTIWAESYWPRPSAHTEPTPAVPLSAAVRTACPATDATPSAQADHACVPPGIPMNAMLAQPSKPPLEAVAVEPVPSPRATPAPALQPPPAAKPAIPVPPVVADTARGTPVAQRGTANPASTRVDELVPPRASVRSERPAAMPNLAEIMDAQDRAKHVRPAVTKVEIMKPESTKPRLVGPPAQSTPELQIKGAKRPEKKRKERDRGRER
ncbi:MobA/MobL family protein [Methylobacterium sp. E-066]|uniref:MobA/MobL family protein n=1 Tax=Methylobacterium sp. E-066 TaxID=2836584 RepID=UPI001FBACFB7|nr:MobA/MobL family protein [Methylobacterium sp. E-066]MCJ2143872.1 MobA/MobL family protein [Methylobacterium sp. E-066]